MRELNLVAASTPSRKLTVLAQDPSIAVNGAALTTQVRVPEEPTIPGPHGHRVRIIDFDASRGHYYAPYAMPLRYDEFEGETDIGRLVSDPRFHAQNVYAIAMSTLWQFEAALGRHVPWAFASRGHQLNIAPHAFSDANAFYSREDEGLFFGYVPRRNGAVFTCLSFDVVTHETTHALLDGLRTAYMRPSSPDQAAFHEGFADVIAILSVLNNVSVVERLLTLGRPDGNRGLISADDTRDKELRESVLFQLAEELGPELASASGQALRHSIRLEPSPDYYRAQKKYEEPHRRGEVLVAAMMRAFLQVWGRRLDPLGRERGIEMNLRLVAEEAATAAEQLMRMAIRALDYCPPVDLSFGDYLSALATADHEVVPDDGRYRYRKAVIDWFGRYGIVPAANATVRGPARGIWDPPSAMSYGGTHFETLRRDPDAVFRFIWRNQKALEIDTSAFTRVYFVRPCIRMGLDRFVVQETVAEYVQTLDVAARDLHKYGIRKPAGVAPGQPIRLYGGGTLIFDEFGRLKFHIGTGVKSRSQTDRLGSMAERGYFHARQRRDRRPFAELHRNRSYVTLNRLREAW